MKKKISLNYFYLIFLGVLSSFSLPPYNFFWINFFTLSLFFVILFNNLRITHDHKIFFLYGWLFGFGYFASNVYWISISLTFDDNFKFLIPFTIVLIPSFLALFYGLISYLFFIFNKENFKFTIFIFTIIWSCGIYQRNNSLRISLEFISL